MSFFESSKNNFRLFGKLAAVYSHNTFDWTYYTNNGVTTTSGEAKNNFWTAMAALGAQFDLNSDFYLGGQAVYVMGNNDESLHVPALWGAVGTVGFRF